MIQNNDVWLSDFFYFFRCALPVFFTHQAFSPRILSTYILQVFIILTGKHTRNVTNRIRITLYNFVLAIDVQYIDVQTVHLGSEATDVSRFSSKSVEYSPW